MEILKTIEIYLNAAIRQKALKIFKKEFPVKTINAIELLDEPFTKFKLTQTSQNANEEYRKIVAKVIEDFTKKIVEKIDEIIK